MKVKKALCFLFALIMLLSFMPTVQKVYAEEILEVIPEVIPEEIPEETTKFDVSGSKTADPTELEGDDRETTVTLSLPSAEYKYVYDIVFVMDSSSSTTNNNVNFGNYCKELFDALIEKDATINVGVIKCRGRAFDTISLVTADDEVKMSGLVQYGPDTAQTIVDAINFKESDLKKLSSGTNMHGGLVMANEMLVADESVSNDMKYVFFLLDGKTYIWNNEANEPTTVYTQYQNSGGAHGEPTVGQVTGAYSKSAYKHKDQYYYDYTVTDGVVSDMTKCFYTPSYEVIYNSDNAELASTDTKYDFYCYYADNKGGVNGTKLATANGSSVTRTVTNGGQFTYNIHKNYYEFTPVNVEATENTPAINWKELNYLQGNPYEVIKDEEAGTYTYDLEKPNEDFYQVHPDSLQKALYLTGHLWTEMNEKYTTAALIYSGWGSGSGLELAKSFDTWIKGETISDYSAEITETEELKAAFDAIKEDILYMVSSGTVTDQITDDFTLKNEDNKDAFRMTRSGEALTVTYADGKWNFGTNVDGVYPYVVEYDADTKTITWTINVPIENANPVTLSYDLILREDAGSAFYDTNVSAVLDYVTTDGKEGSFTFEIPEVSYIRHIDIPVEKIWEDNDNEYDTRPESISVNLLVGEEVVDTAEIKDDGQGNWVYTFEDLPDSELVEKDGEKTIKQIEYEVEEPETVAGYKAPEIVVIEGEVEAGVIITNVQEDLVTITYILNGGQYNGDPSDIVEKYPKGVVISIHEAPVRDGYTFLYWKGSEYDPGDEYTVTEDHEFVAQWEEPAPQTGEENRLLLWILIMAIAYIDLFSVMFIEKKRRMNRSHE